MDTNISGTTLFDNEQTFSNLTEGYLLKSTSYIIQKLSPSALIIYMASVVLMVTSFMANGLVLTALRSAETDSLKSSFMIQGVLISDIVLSVALGTQVFPYILRAFGCDPVQSITCYETFSLITLAVFIIQLYMGLALALDRLVSVLRPLKYHTIVYSKFQKTAILGGIWVSTLALYFGFIISELPGELKKDGRHICLVLEQLPRMNAMLNGVISPLLAVVAIFSTLSLYLIIFGAVIRNRISRRRLSHSKNKVQRSNASLALTLFLVHLTYLFCYLPVIIQFVFFGESLRIQALPQSNINAYALTTFIYQCNTILDPIIFAWRIRFIRHYIRSIILAKKTGQIDTSTVVSVSRKI